MKMPLRSLVEQMLVELICMAENCQKVRLSYLESNTG